MSNVFCSLRKPLPKLANWWTFCSLGPLTQNPWLPVVQPTWQKCVCVCVCFLFFSPLDLVLCLPWHLFLAPLKHRSWTSLREAVLQHEVIVRGLMSCRPVFDVVLGWFGEAAFTEPGNTAQACCQNCANTPPYTVVLLPALNCYTLPCVGLRKT